MVQLSHVLYRVNDLHLAVKKLREAGFVVEYGTHPNKAYNALIWFEKGVFLEIYTNSSLPTPVKWLMKTFGYKPVLDRMSKWDQVEKGWCEWSLESTEIDLQAEKKFFNQEHIPFKFHRAKRKDDKGQLLRWELLIPNNIDLPFIMSAYSPNPRPKEIRHPNGVKSVESLIVGKDGLDINLLLKLLPDHTQLTLQEGVRGLQSVRLDKESIKIEDIV